MKPDPKRPYKAYAALLGTFVFAILAFWVGDDGPFTAKEFGQAVLLAAGAAGLTGGTTYQIKNPKV